MASPNLVQQFDAREAHSHSPAAQWDARKNKSPNHGSSSKLTFVTLKDREREWEIREWENKG